MEFFHRATSFPFMSTRKVWYGLSIILILISVVSLATRGLNLGVDFTGGVTVQANFPNSANRDAVVAALQHAGYADPQVTIFGSARDILVRLPPTKLSTEVIRADRTDFAWHRRSGADPAGGSDRPAGRRPIAAQRRAGAAGHPVLIFGYIAVRFHTWRLSFGAILAVLHDPILVLGTFSLSQTPFDLTVVAAMLAVIGYSLNDTVVVFDRIRERFHVGKRLDPVVVLDQSINQTLSRTIMTKVVTLIVVVALYALGGPVLRGFSEALIIGILAGTYSSIYISSAVALDCGLKAEHLLATEIKKPIDDLP